MKRGGKIVNGFIKIVVSVKIEFQKRRREVVDRLVKKLARESEVEERGGKRV